MADDAALQLELASKRHKEAIEVVVGKLNVACTGNSEGLMLSWALSSWHLLVEIGEV